MTSHYRHRRIFDPAAAFPTLIEPGEIAVNTANRQLAVGDANPGSAGSQLPLLAVRYFDARAQYAANEYVVQAGGFYRSKVSITPAVFDATQWDAYITGADARAYVDAGDAAITADYEAADAALTTAVNGKVDKSGGTMAGYLTLYSNPPSAPLHAATKQYVDQQVAAGGIVSLPALNIIYTPTGTIASTNVQDALTELSAEKAPLYSPDLQGVPTTVTPPSPDNSNKITNTAWVQNYTSTYVVNYVGSYYAGQASGAQPLMNGVVSVGGSTKFAREDHCHPTDTSRAPINNPALTGNPTAPTPNQSNNSQSIATTAFIAGKFATYAPLVDPVFTGNPQAPTPAPGDADTSIATTAFVASAIAAGVSGGAIAKPVEYILASKTVTIPPGAHSLDVTLVGGGGGANADGAGGAGATLFKSLTGLTPGNTLALAVGGGGVGGAPGAATSLSSGTQAITALTAGGGGGGGWPLPVGLGAGGVATNGDLNINGQAGVHVTADDPGVLGGGSSLYGFGALSAAANGYGAGGALQGSRGGANGTPGLAILRWYP